MPKVDHVALAEQETTIQFDKMSDVAHICTSDHWMKVKFDKYCTESPNHWKKTKEDEAFSFYEVSPKRLITYRKEPVVSHLTEEQIEASRVRLAEYRAKMK